MWGREAQENNCRAGSAGTKKREKRRKAGGKQEDEAEEKGGYSTPEAHKDAGANECKERGARTQARTSTSTSARTQHGIRSPHRQTRKRKHKHETAQAGIRAYQAGARD